jgi:erythromycin esterase
VLREVAIKYAIDSAHIQHLEERYGRISKELANRKVEYDSVVHKTKALIFDYQALYEELKQYGVDSLKMLQFSLVTLQNRIRFLSYMLAFAKDKDWGKRWAARDLAMAANIEWLCEEVFKDEPVVVIGHNYHIARFNEKESTMGEILARKYGGKMYALGVFAGAGSFHDNAGKEVQMLPPDSASLDIKHVISSLNGTVNFLDIPQKRKPGSDWLDHEITINDTFINLNQGNRMVLSHCFDGLLLIDKVSPPDKQ